LIELERRESHSLITLDTHTLEENKETNTKKNNMAMKNADCVQETLQMAFHSGAMGVFVGSVVAAWKTDPQLREQTGPVLRATFHTIKTYTVVLTAFGSVYAGTRCLLKEWRKRDDVWNGVGGSLVTGILVGLRRRSFNVSCGASAVLAAVTLGIEYSGLDQVRERRLSSGHQGEIESS
jgi:hypothetical protein